MVRWDVHELVLWRHVVEVLAPAGRYREVVIPAHRTALLRAARARERSLGGPLIRSSGRPSGQLRRAEGWLRRHLGPGVKDLVRAAIAAVHAGPRGWPELMRRGGILDRRLDRLRAARVDVLSVVSGRVVQPVQAGGRDGFVDPNLAFVLDRLGDDGYRVASVAVAIDHRTDTDWRRVLEDERVIPESMLRARYALPGDDAILPIGSGGQPRQAVGRFDVDGVDLSPALTEILERHAGSWLHDQRRRTIWAERLLRDLRPGALFLDREDSRTPWMAAARRVGIPIVAVQHGVIYPGNPAYCVRAVESVVLPERMCVFGPYEREVLTRHGPYDPERVVVTGSSRLDAELMDGIDREADRTAIRHALGVADGHRMLVVSVAHNPIGGDVHSVAMVARLFGGPLPGVHLVVKQHPLDRQTGLYERLVAGMARAGGYAPTPLTVVRDIDLHRLLRAADAHLGQYSTVLTDAVAAGTPNMIAVGVAFDDHLGYVAARVATPVRSVDDVRAFMADPRPAEAADRARFLRRHFRPGDATGRVAAVVIEEMRSVPAPEAADAPVRVRRLARRRAGQARRSSMRPSPRRRRTSASSSAS
jgi:hypothetical protein